MHLRRATIVRDQRTYRYAQFVESYRRESDGVPAHRVVASLGVLTDLEFENLRHALEANRAGRRVVADGSGLTLLRPEANLRYLDLAVLVTLWEQWGMDRVLEELLPQGEAEVGHAKVVLALVLQRCVDPGSKLYAERWFPRTALPELLGIAPSRFNNTRLHRVLEELDIATPGLMARLPKLYLDGFRAPGFATLYMDVTDAEFVGHGPTLAVRARTKEGAIRRKIGIVLLCNELGWPLHWRVVEGNSNDSTVMKSLFTQMAESSWARDVPIVTDRAMGRTALIREMAATGLQFLTALVTTEFDNYAQGLPYDAFFKLDISPEADEESQQRAIEAASQQAREHGLDHVADNLWVCDLGVVEWGGTISHAEHPPAGSAAEAVQLCRKIEQQVAQGQFGSFNAAGRALGLSPSLTKKYRVLGRLPADVLDAIGRVEGPGCSLGQLLRIARRGSTAQQRTRFAALIKAVSAQRAPRARPIPQSRRNQQPLFVRVVAYFNPVRFVEQRIGLRRLRDQVEDFVRELNARAASPRTRLDRAGILAAVDRRLRRDDLLGAYRIEVTELDSGSRVHYQVQLVPVATEWERRRRYHGFSVLVGHANLKHTAAQLCKLYRAKDTVEKDFQIIKSLVKLRPIRHRTDTKVRAHVTLCMLALFLERALDHALHTHGSAQAAIEILSTCHLNRYRVAPRDPHAAYTLTEPNAQQAGLLRKLHLLDLADQTSVLRNLTPRLYLH